MRLINGIPNYPRLNANLWHFLLALVLLGAQFTFAATDCELDHLTGILARTSFVDPYYLRTQTEKQLKESLTSYRNLQAKLKANLEERKVHPDGGDIQAELRNIGNVEQYILAIGRALETTAKGSKSRVAMPAEMTIKVGSLKFSQLLKEILSALDRLKVPRSKLVIRFFASARQDLVQLHGTDRYGLAADSATVWDEFGQNGILTARGLLPEDGIFADFPDAAFTMRGELPSGFEEEFMLGARSLAVYDLDQLEDLESDLFIFKKPAQKRKALLAIIRPVQ
ncbi:MAG: hypothetical protein ACXVA9_05395 [Bdellovibrionales bacterium]